jgi:hypothetical protein
MTSTPTNTLRFVEREERHWQDDRTYNVRRVRILQQWWEPAFFTEPGEWRDVPVEMEEECPRS